jgi:pyrroline-5-carboxylate reductase
MTTVTVVGCGNMGSAIVKGLARAGNHEVSAADPDTDALETVEPYAAVTATDAAEVTDTDIVFVAVKPHLVGDVVDSLELDADQTLVTIAAGVPVEFVAERTDATVVRIMPNLAAETGDMAAAVTWDEPDTDLAAVLDDLGAFVEIDEDLMDVATALNGSGPAFVFYLLQAMKQGAVAEGLSDEQAETLAVQTFVGAAETVRHDDRSLDELIDAVCSPNGTTIEGMDVLWDSDADEAVADALAAAAERSAELAKESSDD